ncbi:terminase small subunit [Akkermansiaceae bacterium]|nr:terminase small subunit [Akkermansiaceae bacterium]
MAETKNKNKPIPSLAGYGGVRTLQKNLEKSTTLAANREAVVYSLLSIANTKVTDIMEWDHTGQVQVKASKDIPEHALQAIKSVKIDKDGQVAIEMWDKVGILRILAKASGLLDNPEESDKPSVIGINIKAPEVIDNEES